MEDNIYHYAKDFIMQHLYVLLMGDLTQRQWEYLFIDIQDIFIQNEPRKNKIHKPFISNRILNPDIKEFVEQTNRRLKDAR